MVILRLAVVLTATALISLPGWSQTGSGQSQPTAPAPSTGGTNPRTPPLQSIPMPTPAPQAPPPEMERPIFLYGRVMTDAGTPPSGSVAIQSVCSGRVRTEGYTDSKGRFNLEFGKPMGVFQDASVDALDDSPQTRNLRGSQSAPLFRTEENRLQNCELQASLPGFRSESVSLAMRRYMDDPNVGTIIVHQLGKVEGRTVSANNMQAPKDARKALEKGIGALRKGKADEAIKQFQKATAAYPEYSSAWAEMGKAQLAAGQAAEARDSLRKAIAADEKFLPPYLTLASIQAQAAEWGPLAETTSKIIALDAYDYPQAHFYHAVAEFNLGHVESAEKSALKAQEMDTRKLNPQTWHLLGAIAATRGDYSGAAERMRAYVSLAPNPTDKDRAELAAWEAKAAQAATR